MDTVLDSLKGNISHWTYIVVMPVFFIVFSLLYNPFGLEDCYTFGRLSYSFHIVMLTTIIFLVMLTSRLILRGITHRQPMNGWQYLLWCLMEVIVSSSFMALYTSLFRGRTLPYFTELSTCLRITGLTLVYPYLFLFLQQIIYNKIEQLDARNNPGEKALVRFYDEHKRLKLTISPAAILYINAENNYIRIHYLDADKPKEFMLRNSMKSVEGSAGQNGLVRCQRSYYVNPSHVKVLRKDKDGFIYADLDTPDIPPVPVSKQYYDAISSLL